MMLDVGKRVVAALGEPAEVLLSYSFVKGSWFRPNVTKRITVAVPVEQIIAPS